MKRIYLLLVLFVAFTANSFAQGKHPNLSIMHFWGTSSTTHIIADNEKMKIDGVSGIYYEWDVINHGTTATDTIAPQDTVKVRSAWGTTYKITWGANGFPNGMSQHDTVTVVPNPNPVVLSTTLTTSQNDVSTNWCDSVFIVSSLPAATAAVDADNSNNKKCNTILMTHWKTNVEEVIGGNGLLIYPNPVTYKLNIKYNFVNTDASVQVVDVAGKVVYAKDLGKNLNGMQAIPLDLTNLNKGMYFLQLNLNDKVVTDKFFVRQ